MPRRRARGRSPYRDGAPFSRNRDHQPASEPVAAASSESGSSDEVLLEGAQEAVRMAAEVVDIALVAAAVAMRELVIRLDGRGGASGAGPTDQR